jgi:hypothetical protein
MWLSCYTLPQYCGYSKYSENSLAASEGRFLLLIHRPEVSDYEEKGIVPSAFWRKVHTGLLMSYILKKHPEDLHFARIHRDESVLRKTWLLSPKMYLLSFTLLCWMKATLNLTGEWSDWHQVTWHCSGSKVTGRRKTRKQGVKWVTSPDVSWMFSWCALNNDMPRKFPGFCPPSCAS